MNNLRNQYDKTILPIYSPPAPVFVRGEGARLWDDANKEYVDFGGGIATVSLGHTGVAAAICQQAQKLMHISNLHANEAAVLLAQTLCDETFAARVFLCNSGAEANEAALKLARYGGVLQHADKYEVLAFTNGFHGRIGLAMAASGQDKVRAGFGPLAAGFSFAPYNDLAAVKEKINKNTCAIIVEPIQGEGGVIPAAAGFLRGLRELADEVGALLLFDEIQTGAGRTGDLYAYMSEGVIPDVLTTAKGLGGGFPVAAMLANDKAAHILPPGAHGSTFGGNPLAASAASAVLAQLLSPGFLEGVKTRGEDFVARLTKTNDRFKCFTDIRGRGLLIGCQMRDELQATDVVSAALEMGLIIITAGGNVLRFAPALNIAPQDVEDGFLRLQNTLEKVCG
ncbi:MAG: aspartate aminotransferase family protein [Gammaproteobacteria bacterium WSBS_2016_MAG_OTU1]